MWSSSLDHIHKQLIFFHRGKKLGFFIFLVWYAKAFFNAYGVSNCVILIKTFYIKICIYTFFFIKKSHYYLKNLNGIFMQILDTEETPYHSSRGFRCSALERLVCTYEYIAHYID